MSLSDERLIYEGEKGGFWYSEDKVKKFIKDLQYWGHIDLGKQTLTIDYDKFKELTGKDLI